MADPAPTFSPQVWMDLFLKGRHDDLCDGFLAVLRHFRDHTYTHLDAKGARFVDGFVKHFLTLFTEPRCAPSRPRLVEFVRLNLTISNVVAMSSFGTTDPFLATLDGRPESLGKRLALTSARNRAPADRAAYFDADPELASVWYGAYAEVYRAGMVREDVEGRLRDHFAYQDDRLDVALCSLDGYSPRPTPGATPTAGSSPSSIGWRGGWPSRRVSTSAAPRPTPARSPSSPATGRRSTRCIAPSRPM